MLWIIAAFSLLIIQIISILIIKYRRPDKAVAWLIILFMFPLVGFIPYCFIARKYNGRILGRNSDPFKAELWDRSSRRIPEHRLNDTVSEKMYTLFHNKLTAPITACHETTVYTEGEEAIEAILESIEAAKHHVHIEFYIFRDDDLGSRLGRLLIRKAQEGVKVRLLYDGVGSRSLGKTFIKQLRQAGVEIGCFSPLISSFFKKRLYYRNHRKIVVVDGTIGFFGGLNIGDEYLGKDPTYGYWRDTHYSMKGDSVLWIQYTFLTDWYTVKGKWVTGPAYYPVSDHQGGEWAQIVKSGPDEPIHELIFSFIVSAKKRLYIETPYFVPDPGILLAIKTAVLSGVDVRIIIPGTPDKKLVYNCTLSYVQEMLEAGVRFYCYQKGFLHAKVLISDDLACSGSTNMDMRSFSDQFELNAVFFDRKIVDRLVQDFFTDLGASQEIQLSEFEKRPTLQKMREIFSRLLSPLF
ncbi:cardiolipin synthase [Paenibacillus caui]|uniref:cardiolipin synthase n=1 Tax=Paenibacillus caui TaxID=2873927 RepID=UPI001CA9EDAD|nr:cardiolipin synthase [Paenibacillus caui]